MASSKFFIYVHIPYCRSRCTYCNFITFENGQTVPVKDYVQFLKKEIQNKARFFKNSVSETVYFGGGTPSLIPSEDLTDILKTIKQHFTLKKDPEITIEVNPGTITEKDLEIYQKEGVNRFSLGVQTFNQWFLEKSRRFHTVEDSLKDLKMFQKHHINYSLDLMFGLPQQTISDLKFDVQQSLLFDPYHISLYNLTIPPGHELSKNRASEIKQKEMFEWIEQYLAGHGLEKYEISNFAKAPYFSRHNLAYWGGETVLGLGISAHSYLSPNFQNIKESNPYGIRFWNSSQMTTYLKQASQNNLSSPFNSLNSKQVEILNCYESLTDFCYTRLRTRKGLCLKELKKLYPKFLYNYTRTKLHHLINQNWLKKRSSLFSLTPKGEILSNQVFLELTFLKKDFKF
ncbi:MAG: radical SAM family heme chaperone HemW [Bdellovibrionales bacterium]